MTAPAHLRADPAREDLSFSDGQRGILIKECKDCGKAFAGYYWHVWCEKHDKQRLNYAQRCRTGRVFGSAPVHCH